MQKKRGLMGKRRELRPAERESWGNWKWRWGGRGRSEGDDGVFHIRTKVTKRSVTTIFPQGHMINDATACRDHVGAWTLLSEQQGEETRRGSKERKNSRGEETRKGEETRRSNITRLNFPAPPSPSPPPPQTSPVIYPPYPLPHHTHTQGCSGKPTLRVSVLKKKTGGMLALQSPWQRGVSKQWYLFRGGRGSMCVCVCVTVCVCVHSCLLACVGCVSSHYRVNLCSWLLWCGPSPLCLCVCVSDYSLANSQINRDYAGCLCSLHSQAAAPSGYLSTTHTAKMSCSTTTTTFLHN